MLAGARKDFDHDRDGSCHDLRDLAEVSEDGVWGEEVGFVFTPAE